MQLFKPVNVIALLLFQLSVFAQNEIYNQNGATLYVDNNDDVNPTLCFGGHMDNISRDLNQCQNGEIQYTRSRSINSTFSSITRIEIFSGRTSQNISGNISESNDFSNNYELINNNWF